ncbi:MAG TPA: RsmE family RNA methyltransferase [Actinomycetota bacterium]|nr:RsmE family RNA methyltransferase [Actinomycetota bacterium]
MATAPWFYAPPASWSGDVIELPLDESRHALRSLRIRPPDIVTVTDGAGTVARAAATRLDGETLVVEVLERREHRRPKPAIAVYQGAPKGHKADEIVERLAELGAAEVTFFESERTVARWSAEKVVRSTERWHTIARSAATQSRNPYVLEASAGVSWTELVRRIAREDFAVVLWEEASVPLRAALSGTAERVALVVGPEGGLSRTEAEGLADAGAQLVSLGPTILRTEVAPVVTAAALLYHYGVLG